MIASNGKLNMSPKDAYCGMGSAFRKGDYVRAAGLAARLRLDILDCKVGGLGPREIAVIVETEKESRRRLGIEKEAGTHE